MPVGPLKVGQRKSVSPLHLSWVDVSLVIGQGVRCKWCGPLGSVSSVLVHGSFSTEETDRVNVGGRISSDACVASSITRSMSKFSKFRFTETGSCDFASFRCKCCVPVSPLSCSRQLNSSACKRLVLSAAGYAIRGLCLRVQLSWENDDAAVVRHLRRSAWSRVLSALRSLKEENTPATLAFGDAANGLGSPNQSNTRRELLQSKASRRNQSSLVYI